MTKIVLDVEYPRYFEAELNIDKIVAVVPNKKLILFDSVYWQLDFENFNKFYEIWKGKKEQSIPEIVDEHFHEMLDDAVVDSNKDGLIAETIKHGEHKPVEWSEEDELNMSEIQRILKLQGSFTSYLVDWLKSLRSQKQWKPSEEQIEALDFAIDCTIYPEFQNKRKVLKELLEQLKAL